MFASSKLIRKTIFEWIKQHFFESIEIACLKRGGQ